VAVKTIAHSDNARQRGMFLREARVLAQLDHRGIIQILDFGEVREEDEGFDRGTLYLVMEYAPGGELSCEIYSRLVKHGRS